MNSTSTWLAASVCMAAILAAALITIVFEATQARSPFFDDDDGTVATADVEVISDSTQETASATGNPRQAAGGDRQVDSIHARLSHRADAVKLAEFVQQVRKSKRPRATEPAPAAMPDAFVKEFVTQALARLGQGMQKLRKPVRDAKQLLKWALGVGRSRPQTATG